MKTKKIILQISNYKAEFHRVVFYHHPFLLVVDAFLHAKIYVTGTIKLPSLSNNIPITETLKVLRYVATAFGVIKGLSVKNRHLIILLKWEFYKNIKKSGWQSDLSLTDFWSITLKWSLKDR